MSAQAQRLALGTAQLGQRYGIANRQGQPDLDEARAIVAAARGAAIDTVDTAMVYGDSERVLGTVGVAGLRVITKLAPLSGDVADLPRRLRLDVVASLERLGAPRVYGLLLHRPADVLGPHGPTLIAALRALQDEGLVSRIGVSIYDPSELESLSSALDIGIVQAPYNVFDRRLESSGWLDRLAGMGCEVHTRSAFLQGLLLLDAPERPPQFAAWDGLWQGWRAWLADLRMTPLAAALGFVLRNPAIARVVVGVETADQLRGIVHAANALPVDAPASLACADLDLIDPSRWKRA
jgi:aryl-alcohol dehydrogenase-like predicted oxidoreductase